MPEDDIFGKTIDKIFNLKKETYLIILILILGFVLRLIAAINLGVTADDMHHVTFASNFLKADRLVTFESVGLWHAFTSIMYDLFGMTQLASRMAALIFGTLTIFAVYLLTREFFGKKVSLISAFLIAIAPFHIKNTIAEQDVMAMFFVLTSMFLFIRAMKKEQKILYIISGIFMGLAVYVKVYPVLFLPSFFLFFVYYNKKNKKEIFTKTNVKFGLIFLLAIFVFLIPSLTHNYLLYKDKGFMDLHYTRTFGFGTEKAAEFYSWDPIWGKSNFWSALIVGDSTGYGSTTPWLYIAIKFIFNGDPIVFILGLIGVLSILFYNKKHKDYLVFFLFSILFVLPFLASIILLSKHFLFLEILLIPPAALVISKFNKGKHLKIIIALLLIASLVLLGLRMTGVTHFYGKSSVAQIMEFKEKNIPTTSLIVGDSRIYRGRTHWAFQERLYLEGIEFIQLVNSQDKLSGEVKPFEVYYVECVPDDCGWGTIKDQPDFNASMESLTNLFKQNGKLVEEIKEPSKRKVYFPFTPNNKVDYIRIYKATVPMKEGVLVVASQPKNWLLYDIGYKPKEGQFDYYTAKSNIDKALDKLAHLVTWIAVILTFVSIIYIIILVKKSN